MGVGTLSGSGRRNRPGIDSGLPRRYGSLNDRTLQDRASKPTLPALTGARFAAALYVVTYHYCKAVFAGLPAWLRNIHDAGGYGVDLFFILSGFVLFYNYGTCARTSNREFWAARLRRIYPTYVFAIAMAAPCYIASVFSEHGMLRAMAQVVGAAILVLTFTQAWIPKLPTLWNAPAWSLSAEALFYAIYPRLAPRVDRMASRGVWITVGSALLVFVGVSFVAYRLAGSSQVFTDYVTFHPILRLPEFVMGMLLARQFSGTRSGRLAGPLTDLSIVALFVVLATSAHFALPERLISIGLIAAVVFGLAHGRGVAAKILSIRPLILLGEASYAMYILQEPVATWFKYFADGSFDHYFYRTACFSSPLFVAGYLGTLIVLSVLCYRYYEAPARRYLRRILNGPGRSAQCAS
jgi:peptidoglycan/LPS O-acetylase OafA/YrhL